MNNISNSDNSWAGKRDKKWTHNRHAGHGKAFKQIAHRKGRRRGKERVRRQWL